MPERSLALVLETSNANWSAGVACRKAPNQFEPKTDADEKRINLWTPFNGFVGLTVEICHAPNDKIPAKIYLNNLKAYE